MPVLQSGGSLVTTGSIVDGTILNDDIAAAAAIAQSKIAGMLGNSNDIVSIEVTVGTTHSLTTVAGQKVLVFAKGDITDGTGTGRTIALQYNAVTKDSVGSNTGGSATRSPFALMYTETPGAATQNVTVSTSGGSLANVVIVVVKLKA